MNKQLINIQEKLKAPKSQYSKFGKYNYRSTDDILEALKPLLVENKASLILTDEPVLIGERYYIKATAEFSSEDGGVETTGYAREALNKKGMDESQISGAASSYARKYALNGLFLIDDTKDADSNEYQQQERNARAIQQASQKVRKLNNQEIHNYTVIYNGTKTPMEQLFNNAINGDKNAGSFLKNLNNLQDKEVFKQINELYREHQKTEKEQPIAEPPKAPEQQFEQVDFDKL